MYLPLFNGEYEMKVLKGIITVEKECFGAFLEDVNGIYGTGDTVEEAKESLKKAILLFVKQDKRVPKALKGEYEIKYTFDACGFLKYYSRHISFAGFREITGIHQKQLWNYANGYRKPSKTTSKKIFESVHSFAKELGHVKLSF